MLSQDERIEEDLNKESGLSGIEGILSGNSSTYQAEGNVSNVISDDLKDAGTDSMQVTNYGLDYDTPEDDEPFLYLVKCVKQHQQAIE